MPTPHKHAEVIKAWADGATVQVSTPAGWEDMRCAPGWFDYNEYRIKPEPAAPKWPQTTMTYKQMEAAYLIAGDVSSWHSEAAIFLANAAIAHACETGQVVTSDQYNERIKSHQDLTIALRDSIRREHELGTALHKAMMALAAIPKGVESSLLDGMVERCLPAAKETLFYGLRIDEMSRDQLLAIAFKGWQIFLEARTPVDLVAFHKEPWQYRAFDRR